jgi:SpoVK/Ycf46/Vps4 family AAA+-type ATPase
MQIEKDDSNSLIIAATNMPEALDEALFRRFDDIIIYPLPTLESIELFYYRLLSKHISVDEILKNGIANKSLGLSYAEIQKVCEDFLKHIFLYGENNSNIQQIIDSIDQRKKRTY